MKQKSKPARIEIGGEGIGEVSDEMISERARQLARADGRDDANAADFEEASAELIGHTNDDVENREELIAEEDRPGNGVPPTESGTHAPRLEPEDEDSVAAAEVEEGIAEAEIDTRKRSRERE